MKYYIPLILCSSILAANLPSVNQEIELALANNNNNEYQVKAFKHHKCSKHKPTNEPQSTPVTKPSEVQQPKPSSASEYKYSNIQIPVPSYQPSYNIKPKSSSTPVYKEAAVQKPEPSYIIKPKSSATPVYKETNEYKPVPSSKPSEAQKPKPSNPPAYKTDYEYKPKPSSTKKKPEPTSNNSGLTNKSIEMLCRVNAVRAKAGKKPLKLDDRLMRAAQKHSTDQNAHKKMTHEGASIKSFWDRIKAEGYTLKSGSENIAWNQKDIASVMDAWVKSSGHYANLVSDAECFGWGEAGLYWTQNFSSGTQCTSSQLPNCPKF